MSHYKNRSAGYLFIIIFAFFGMSVFASNTDGFRSLTSQQMRDSRSLNDLTKSLLINVNAKSSLQVIESKAKERLALMQEVASRDPVLALRYAFSKKVRAIFPVSAQQYIEEELQDVSGTYDASCAFSDKIDNPIRYHVRTANGDYFKLVFLAQPTKLPQSGDKIKLPLAIRIPGSAQESMLIIPEGSVNNGLTALTATPSYPTTGVFKTLVIMANFQDQPTNKPWTPDAIKAVVANEVSGFDAENSFQKTSLTVNATDYYTLPYNSTDNCETVKYGIMSSAISQANAAGAVTGNYDRLLIVYPRMSNCAWVGLGWIGGGKAWGQAWINGMPTKQVIGHEMGHNFGLNHSHSLTCTGGTIGGTCTSSEYGDTADIMGNKTATHFAASQKESLGWLDSTGFPGITTVQTSGTYVLEPYETNTLNRKAIRIPLASPVTSTSQYYYLEYRQLVGHDASLPGNLAKGVLIRKGNMGGTTTNSWMLNMTPTDTSFYNAAIVPGSTFTDASAPNGGVTIAVTAADTNGATLAVKFGGATPTCTRANPTLAVNPNTTTWVSPGGNASYVVTLLNNDSVGCGASTFNLSAIPSPSTTAALNIASLTALPGESKAVSLTITSSATAAAGVYTTGVSAVNSASTVNKGTVNASLGVQLACVKAAPTLTITPMSQSTSDLTPVKYAVTIKNNDSVGCGTTIFGSSGSASSPNIKTFFEPYNHIISPGGSSNSVFTLTPLAGLANGTYTADITIGNAMLSKATVTMNYVANLPCVRANPLVVSSPTTQTGPAGVIATYAMTITNKDSATCPASTFTFDVSAPTGFSASFGASTASLNPGESASSSLQMNTSSTATAGTYSLVAQATNDTVAGFVGATTVSYVIPALH